MNKQLSMFTFPKIGIVGLGFVGSAIRDAYQDKNFNTVVVDVNPELATGTYNDLLDCEAVFVCVPSPSKANGECDTSILNSVLYLLKDYKNVIISKTTSTPDFYERIQKVYPNLVHVPEFLTASNALKDFLNQEHAVIGGSWRTYRNEAERILKAVQPIKTICHCSIGEAALVKYIVNSFLATKVVYMNEMHSLAEKLGYNWLGIVPLLMHEPRIGSSHLQVPGPDGQFGFGGMCFPKDTEALIKFANKQGVNINILKSAIKKNDLLRLKKPK